VDREDEPLLAERGAGLVHQLAVRHAAFVPPDAARCIFESTASPLDATRCDDKIASRRARASSCDALADIFEVSRGVPPNPEQAKRARTLQSAALARR